MLEASAGSIVADPSGRRYGRLDEVFAGRRSGRPEFGIVALDEEGSERVAVPLDGARSEGSVVVLPFDVDDVVAAPRVQGEIEEIPAAAGRLIRAQFGLDDGSEEPTAVTPAVDDDARPPATAGEEVEVVVSEEQLAVDTRRVATERVRVRKAVVTEEVTVTVTLRREELVIERHPIDDGPGPATAGDEPVVGDGTDLEFVLHTEEPVVTKRVVPVERVRLRRDELVEERRITDTVRKERVEVDQPDTHLTQEHTTP
jgi:uncharacterized protein (TIGR02271 family)